MDEYLRIIGVSYENSMDFECFSNNLEGDAPGSPRMHHLYLLYNLVRDGDCQRLVDTTTTRSTATGALAGQMAAATRASGSTAGNSRRPR